MLQLVLLIGCQEPCFIPLSNLSDAFYYFAWCGAIWLNWEEFFFIVIIRPSLASFSTLLWSYLFSDFVFNWSNISPYETLIFAFLQLSTWKKLLKLLSPSLCFICGCACDDSKRKDKKVLNLDSLCMRFTIITWKWEYPRLGLVSSDISKVNFRCVWSLYDSLCL